MTYTMDDMVYWLSVETRFLQKRREPIRLRDLDGIEEYTTNGYILHFNNLETWSIV